MAGRHLGSAGTLQQSTTTPARSDALGEGLLVLGGHSPHNKLGGHKLLDLKCRWLNQPVRSLLPGHWEDAPSPFIWDSGCTGQVPAAGSWRAAPPVHRALAMSLDKATGDQKAIFALYLFKRFVCSQLSLTGAFSAPISTELETADSKGTRAGGSALRVRVTARMTWLPTQPLGLPVITTTMAALPFHPLHAILSGLPSR